MRLQDIKTNLLVHARPHDRPGTGSFGVNVGRVEGVEEDGYVKLRWFAPEGDRVCWIPLAWVTEVDDRVLYLSKTVDEVTAATDTVPCRTRTDS